ncbi:hypothetical protein NPIL_291151, partial [Nephila pilipes]
AVEMSPGTKERKESSKEFEGIIFDSLGYGLDYRFVSEKPLTIKPRHRHFRK